MEFELMKDIWDKVDIAVVVKTTVGIAILGQLYRWWSNRINAPAYGGIVSFSRRLAFERLMREKGDIWKDSYAKYPMLLIPSRGNWSLVVRGPYVEEINRAGDDVLSFHEAVQDMIQLQYSIGLPAHQHNEYHIQVIRNNLTRHLPAVFPEVHDEVTVALSDALQFQGEEWKEIHFLGWAIPVIARASNRVFVGLPLCRNGDYLKVMIETAVSCIDTAKAINGYPEFMRPLVGRLLSKTGERKEKIVEFLKDVVDDRLKLAPEDRPDDYVSWLLNNAPPEEQNVGDIALRVIGTNFAAIHTSSMNITQAVYWLLAKPEYITPLREEIEEVTSKMGWTKNAIGSMPKLESFMKECMRMTPLGPQTMSRKVLKPFRFSNGVSVPVGATVGIHLYATHQDPKIYPEPERFNGFRFVEAEKEGAGDENFAVTKSRTSMYASSLTYLPFSYGRHACPGRFFAAMELKLLFAMLINNYDMKWPEAVSNGRDGYRPADVWSFGGLSPDPTARILIRERKA